MTATKQAQQFPARVYVRLSLWGHPVIISEETVAMENVGERIGEYRLEREISGVSPDIRW